MTIEKNKSLLMMSAQKIPMNTNKLEAKYDSSLMMTIHTASKIPIHRISSSDLKTHYCETHITKVDRETTDDE